MASVFDAKRTANGVRYWSVTSQVWRHARTQFDISDADHAGLDQRDRALIASLPLDWNDDA